MAVALASIDPADTAINQWINYPVVAELTDATDLDPSLVELVVNGVSCTVANGGLTVWNTKTISGGAVVDDYTDIYCGITVDWWDGSVETITVDVNYDSSLVQSTTFTLISARQPCTSSPQDVWYAEAFRSARGAVRFGAYWVATQYESYLFERGIHFYVRLWSGTSFDDNYLVARWLRESQAASAIVAHRWTTAQDSSLIVYGPATTDMPATIIVQGPVRTAIPATATVGIRYRYGQAVSAICGIQTITALPASAVVFGSIDGPVIEIEVQDQATVDALTALGVVFDR